MRTGLALFAFAFAVRIVLIVLHPDPAYPDSFYYADVARSLQAGQGFSVDFVWIFAEVGGRIPANPVLPIPSNAHWMPLASLVQVPFLAIFGLNAIAAALPFALIGSLAAPLTWLIAREAGSSKPVALGAGLLISVPALTTPFMVQPDNFSLYQPLVAGALWLAARGLKGDARSFALAGLLVGVATLARNDGVLVGAVVGLAFVFDRWRAWRSAGSRAPRIPVVAAVACLVLFLVPVVPWFVRQLSVFGSLSPSTASGRVLFIRDIREWNSITGDATLGHLLGQGIGPLLESRVLGLVAAVGIFSILVLGLVLVPFLLIGGWRRRRSVDFGPFLAYAGLLFSFSAIVSAVHVPGGTFIHSAVALAPHAYILALEGVAAVVGWLAARRRGWDVHRAEQVLVLGVALLVVVMGAAYVPSVHAAWDEQQRLREAVATELDSLGAPASDRIMSIDAGGYEYFTGHGGVVTVDDPLPTVESVARAYDIRWLVLERRQIVDSLIPVLGGRERPGWIGAPVFTLQGPVEAVPAGSGASITDAEYPALALYPVCTQPGDLRCTTTP